MTKYPFSKIADLWELFDYSDPITAYRDTFKDDLEFDIVELQTKYADEAKRIEDQMNFINIDPLQMDEKQKRIYDAGFAILECGGDGDCLFKVMALHT